MNRTKSKLLAIVLMLSIGHAHAAESNKVIVIPLGSSSDNVPGNIKTISVSSLTGALEATDLYALREADTCGKRGKVATTGTNNVFIRVPVQLPDNATVTSFTGVFCLNTGSVTIPMHLLRSDGTFLASVTGSAYIASTKSRRKTDNTINEPLVDNAQYAYYVSMGLKGGRTDIYPISAHITLE